MKKQYLLCSIIISSLLGISPAPAGVYDVGDPRPPLNFAHGAQFNQEDTGVCNTNQYPYSGSPDERVGVADTCPDQYGDHYCYTSCHANNGYVHNGSCGCYPQDCSGYPSGTAEIPGCLGVDSCISTQGTRYKCVECNPQGWESDGNGGCQPLVCDNHEFPYHDADPNWRPTVCKVEPLVCYAGDDTYYGCEECNPGYIQDHGLCDIITCGQDFNLDACPEHGICTPCQSGSNPEKYKLTDCEGNYILNNNICEIGDCMPGYGNLEEISDGDKTYYTYRPDENGECLANKCSTDHWLSVHWTNLMQPYSDFEMANCKTKSFCNPDADESWYNGPDGYERLYREKYLYELSNNGAEMRGACFECEEGYTLINSACVANNGVGSIYYHNGSAIGVVFYEDESVIKLIGLDNLEKASWINSDAIEGINTTYTNPGSEFNDIPDLENVAFRSGYEWNFDSEFINDMNGELNTQKIIAYNGEYKAAELAYEYAPEGCSSDSICGEHKWYLPSIGEWYHIMINYNMPDHGGAIMQAFRGLEYLPDNVSSYEFEWYYWSSTEVDNKRAFCWYVGAKPHVKDAQLGVRPALSICKEGYTKVDGECIPE